MSKYDSCSDDGCITCPFSCGPEAEEAQNYGCLPSRFDIIKIKEDSGHNWSCHGNDSILCRGFANHLKEYRPDLDVKTGGLIPFGIWDTEGQDAAIKQASKKLSNDRMQEQWGANIFAQIREVIENGLGHDIQKDDILNSVKEMEQSNGSTAFLEKYKTFISLASNHMSPIAPLLPNLTQMI